MSSGTMPKSEFPELPDDISARLDEAISECVAGLRLRVQRMFRFANMEEVDAARVVLAEKGVPMHVEEILEELKAGGIWRPPSGSKGSGADTEMKRSISKAASDGVNLIYVDREKKIIGLPEWSKKNVV